MRTENVVTQWKRYTNLKKSVYNFTGAESRNMRTLVGNFNGSIRNAPWEAPGTGRKKTQKNYNVIMERLMSRKVNTPTLYKGLSQKNSVNFLRYVNLKKRGFLKNAFFFTRAPTSTTTNKFQARAFTSAKNPVILVIPANKRHAIILGQHGVRSKQPREKEVIIAPGKFVLNFVNKNGLYHIK